MESGASLVPECIGLWRSDLGKSHETAPREGLCDIFLIIPVLGLPRAAAFQVEYVLLVLFFLFRAAPTAYSEL